MSEQVEVAELPQCDICGNETAKYDGRIAGRSSWAYMCEVCWACYGNGRLGTGYGQRLVLRKEN